MGGDRGKAKRGGFRRRAGVAAAAWLMASAASAMGLAGDARATGGLAPDVSLTTENGEYHLSQQKGKVVVLYFSFPG